MKRRLGILKTLIQELGLTFTVKLVKSEENKADVLTRVRKRWLVPEMGVGCAALEEVKKMHDGIWRNVWINQPKRRQSRQW